MLCIYHEGCSDGLAAAWAVCQKFTELIRLVPAQYGDMPPEDIAGKDIYIVDFSYDRVTLMRMAEQAKSITIVDHHKTAETNLLALDLLCPNVTTVFDMNHSGCVLTWKYLFKDKPVPQILLHIEDRDLWRFRLPDTRLILSALGSYEQTIDLIGGWAKETDFASLVAEGVTLERKYQQDLKRILQTGHRELTIGGHTVPAINCGSQFVSDVGHELSKGNLFACCYFDLPQKRVYSLRSAEDGLDVSGIARQYGGGGHKHAAGFSVPLDATDVFELCNELKE